MKLEISICTKKYLFEPSLNHVLLFHFNSSKIEFPPGWIFKCPFFQKKGISVQFSTPESEKQGETFSKFFCPLENNYFLDRV